MLLLVFFLGEIIAPSAEQFAQQYRNEKQNKHITLTTRYGFWAKDGQAYINIRQINPGGNLNDIYIYEFNEKRELHLASYAESAFYQEGKWYMKGIKQTEITNSRTTTREIANATWNSILDPKVLNVVIVEPTMLPLWQLYEYISYMHKNGQSAIEYVTAFWTKIINPVAVLVMLFLAVPFVLGSTRSVSNGQQVVIGIFVGTAFFLISKAMSYVSIVFEVSPFLMALLPVSLFIFLGYWLLRRVF